MKHPTPSGAGYCRIISRIFTGLLLLLALNSCVHMDQQSRENLVPVYLSDDAPYYLLYPADIAHPVKQDQILEGYYQDTHYTLYVFVEANREKIEQVALTPIGNEAYSYLYDETGFQFSSALFSREGNPIYMVADFQLVYYSAKRIETELNRIGLEMEETYSSESWTRSILNEGTEIIRIVARDNKIWYTNFLRDYGFTIEVIDSYE